MRIRRHRRRWQANDSTAKYGLMAAMTLLSVGWQLQTAMPAAADQAPASVNNQRPVVSLTKDEVPADGAVQPTVDDEIQEKPLKQAKTALTPDAAVDQSAIARTVARATQSAVAPEVEHQQKAPVAANETAVQPTDPVTTPAAVEPVPTITDDELPTTPVQAYTDETIDQWMPNKILQKAVWLALQDTAKEEPQEGGKTWATPEAITQQDMKRLEALYVTGNGESHGINSYIDGKTEFSLKGLAYAVNLKTISLGAGLNSELDTSKPFQLHGDVVDISPLAYMPKLEYAALDNNRIEDISPLHHLKNLKRLFLTFNHIADFGSLAGRDFSQLTMARQLVTLPPIQVDARTRTAHVVSPYIQMDGEIAELGGVDTGGDTLHQNIVFHLTNDAEGHYWDFVRYHTVSQDDIDLGDGDDEGNLIFNHIPDQKSGDYQPLARFKHYRQVALPDYYYLVGEAYPGVAVTENPDYLKWYVVQPYTIAQEAGAITVHYQDQAGHMLAPDQTLPQGDVGDSYDTSQLAVTIKGYTLMTPPDNAVGTYTDEPISVTYVYRKDLVKPDTTRPPVPEVPGIQPPAEIIPPEVTPPEVTSPEITPPNPVTPPEITPPAVTEPTEVVPPETPPTVALEPTTPVDTAGIGDALNSGSDQQLPQQQAHPRRRPSMQPLSLPQTNDHQSSSWWGVGLLAITMVGGWLGKRRRSK